MAVLGEHYAGAACDTRDVVMMTLGTGIGTGVILGGRLLRGVHAHAGCLGGHFTANFDGERCWCGNIGCAEVEAAGWSLPKLARAWPGYDESSLAQEPDLSFRELIAHAERGDAVAQQVWRRCLQVWSANAVSLVHAYDPEVLVLGGGVLEGAAPIAPFVQDYIERHTWAAWGKAQVRVASLGNTAALLGAVPLLSEEFDGSGI
jgi:glucokinase